MAKNDAGMWIVVGVVLLIIMALSALPHFSRGGYTVTVTDKERITESSGKSVKSKYIVFTQLKDTKEVRVFQNTDSFYELKFNSSDIQGQLQVGKTYHIWVYGWRLGFFSWYENILEVTEIKCENN